MRLLLHICCAPCSIYPIRQFKERGQDIQGYFFNPNIHPFTEWLKRKEALEQYSRETDLTLIVDKGYQMEEFLQTVVYRETSRCRFCYLLRLRQTAKIALKGGFDGFSTTLLVSPFQKHDIIRETGETVGEEFKIPFYYEDFRSGFKEGTLCSKELGMYRQQYCGCVYSEKERYFPKFKRKS